MTDLHTILKQNTADLHRRIEALGLHARLASGGLSLHAYGTYIGALAVVHAVLEVGLEYATHPAPRQLRSLTQAKLPALIRELSTLNRDGTLRRCGAVDLALRFASRLLESAESNPVTLVGTLYVLEGSQNGGLILRESAVRGLGLDPDAVRYLGFYGRDTDAHWSRFVDALEGMEIGRVERAAIISSARTTFSEVHAILQAAIDEAPPLPVPAASILNRDGGGHAIVSDPIELAVALEAGVRARAAFPYLAARFGIRGLHFTASDSCWLVTLKDMSPEAARSEIIWLRGLLSVRGLPSLLLERHLDLLFERLTTLSPDSATRYDRLRELAAFLRADRSKSLPPDRFAALEAAFEPRLAACPGFRIPSMARVLLGAWADRNIIGEQAWGSVFEWTTDPKRFSASWCEVVRALDFELRESTPSSAGSDH